MAGRSWWILTFPLEVASTSLRPDLALFGHDSFPWEDSVEEAYEREKLHYAELVAEAKQRGWNTNLYLVEVGSRGFVASFTRLLKELGIQEQPLWQTSSQWIFAS